MTTEDRMTVNERYKYLRKMKSRYVKASRKDRGRLLDEMEEVTGLHRKSLVRLMKSNLESPADHASAPATPTEKATQSPQCCAARGTHGTHSLEHEGAGAPGGRHGPSLRPQRVG